ncbi:hypothetical protein [Halobacillus yeomjeoni]|uniref:Uncharacterized protein n=1 Tax=Halobacillus yeomjeoni TaxID=311194 RepID=A0A931HX80_9BACI|nr:hypothetical protein [Halobacillus yeomjeoni]MBH0231069.1 hypothetical protein [Halobacillus yeomjeoni]
MDRETLHQHILTLKGKICSGQIQYNQFEDHLTPHLDAVKLKEDGIVDESTISQTLRILLDSVNRP